MAAAAVVSGWGLCGKPELEMAVVGVVESGRRGRLTWCPLSRSRNAIYGESWAPVQGRALFLLLARDGLSPHLACCVSTRQPWRPCCLILTSI